MDSRHSFVFVILILALSSAYAEVVSWQACPVSSTEEPLANCTIHEVRVDPCKEAAEQKPCRVKKGTNASISFDYTADFDADTLETRAFWTNELLDLPFLGMSTDGCKATTCPLVHGKKETFHLTLPISKTYPARAYDVKWKLWNNKQGCCFIFQIKLHK